MLSQLGSAAAGTRLYAVAGRRIALEAAEEWCGRMAATFLSNFYLDSYDGGPEATEADLTVRISADDPPPVLSGLQVFQIRQGVCRTDGETYDLDVNENRVVVLPPAARRINVWMGRTERARHPTARVNVMAYVLHLALRRCSLYDLHSAGVVAPATGAGVLFVGDSNSGKSSLTLRLARAGWRYMSDDFLLLHEEGEGIKVRGLRRPFSVSASSLANCELPRLEEALGAPVNSDPSKRRLDPEVAFPGLRADSAVPRVVFFPVITGEPDSRAEPLGQADVLTRLLRLCPWSSFDVTGRDYVQFLARLARQVRGYALYSGRDMMADPGFAPAFVAAHANV
ncbi:MAG TPA: hypothetical protein VER08_05770 [Pyrinomonadaceae bacterium]|nr:hypothetical protein [Pyrinomonadaceae bacterium]